MEAATAVAELRPVVEAQATAVANLAVNAGQTGLAIISIDAHIGLAVVVGVCVLLFDRVILALWRSMRRAVG